MNDSKNKYAGLDNLLSPDNCVLILIDHQPYQIVGIQSHDRNLVINGAVALAKTAKLFDVPTILTTVVEERSGNLLKEIVAFVYKPSSPAQISGVIFVVIVGDDGHRRARRPRFGSRGEKFKKLKSVRIRDRFDQNFDCAAAARLRSENSVGITARIVNGDFRRARFANSLGAFNHVSFQTAAADRPDGFRFSGFVK